jgi:hypothetical protein
MELQEFLEYMDSGKEVAAGSQVHKYMHKLSQEAIRLTALICSRRFTQIVEKI